MTRPRFSLRLLLLIVALCATIIAWRMSVRQIERVGRDGERESLKLTVKYLELWRDRHAEGEATSGYGYRDPDSVPLSVGIEKLKKQIEQLSQ